MPAGASSVVRANRSPHAPGSFWVAFDTPYEVPGLSPVRWFGNQVAIEAVLDRLRGAKRHEVSASAERDKAVRDAIAALRAEGMSYRDIGTVIGLSHQRVAQLDSEAHV